MAEVESSAGSTRMGLLINGVATGETLKKRPLEDDLAAAGGGGSIKYKRRRNVVVKRDFPRGCEQFSERMNGVSKVGDGSSKVVELEALDDSEVLGRFQAPGSLKIEPDSKVLKIAKDATGQVEGLQVVEAVVHVTLTGLSQSLDSEAAKPLESSKQVEELETVKAVEHETSTHKSQVLDSEAARSLETSDQVEELETVKPLDSETGKSLTLDPETVKPLGTSGPTQNVESMATVLSEYSGQIESSESSKNLQPQNPSGTGLEPPGHSVLRETSNVSKVSDQPQLAVPVVEATVESRLAVKISRGRGSVIRHFPPGCGRNSHSSSRDEYPKEIDSLKDSSAGKGRLTEEHGPTEKSLEDDARPIPEKVEDEDALGVRLKSNADTEIFSLESLDKGFVLALVAAPYQPRWQGKRARKSIPTIGMARDKVKKHELMVMVQGKTTSISKKKRTESENSGGKSEKKKLYQPKMDSYQGLSQLFLGDEDGTREHDEGDENVLLDKKPQDLEVNLVPFGHSISRDKGDSAKVTREKVRETLRVFQVIFRKFLQGEEANSKGQGNTIKRIDLQAATVLKKASKWVNTEKIIGIVPGVEVGDEFHYRVELAIVGIHGPYQSGIDSIKKDGKALATSVIASGGYPDDMDSSDVLIYSGQGGMPKGGEKQRQPENQKLERGNLALKNSMDSRTVVRVTRGFKDTSSSDSANSRGKMKISMTYIYDGLYLVEDYWTESSSYGTSVFKFRLRRIPGQPELAWKEVKKSRKSKVREGLCVVDISLGKEKMLIGAVNTIDDEKPQSFTYITKMIYPDWYNPISPKGCDCTNGCLDPKICSCAAKNGGEIPFNHDGAIVQAKPLVYECGPSCRCPPSCHNRVSQHGIKFQLEIFKTESRGWGVRSLTSIPSGSFVCEYTGELLQDKEAEQRTGNDEYLFDIGHNYNDHTLWEGLPNVIPDLQPSSPCQVVEDVGYTIDAAQYGSIGRFINHSCSPNLYAQNVLYDHDDKRMPHIMLFAAENIPPLKEITYHYNYTIGQVYDAEGNVKEKRCYCGSAECSGRLY